MNAFLRRDGKSPLGRLHRQFEFNDTCKYGALIGASEQVEVIRRLNEDFGEAVYYLFYNPPLVPMSVRYPVVSYPTVTHPPLGCRVYATAGVDTVMEALDEGAKPSLAALQGAGPTSNWRLETWAADLLPRCQVGQQFGDDRLEKVAQLLERRSGPIGAAIAVSIALPDG